MISNSNSEFPNSRMLKNRLMEENRLDLDAPLLSVRRFGASEPDSGGNPNPKRSSLPFYKSDLKSGPVRNPGVVPFVWEHSPGQPKDSARHVRPMAPPALPPGRIPKIPSPAPARPAAVSVRTLRKSMQAEEVKPQPLPSQHQEDEEGEDPEEDEFADALETLSRTESYFLNCSEPSEASRTFSTADRDPQEAKDFMMDRFLPAAKAMATGSPHASSRKPPPRAKEIPDRPRSRVPLSYPYGPYSVRDDAAEEEEEEEEDDDDCYESNNEHFSGKGCGLIPNFCFKSSLCLLNPVPGMKVPNRRLASKRMGGRQVKAMPNGSLGQAEEEYSWEAVYKHKLTQTHSPKEEDRSKITSESDHLTYGSDSQTADGSSPYRRSNGGGISPYRNEHSQSPFYEGKGFLGVPQREKKNSTHDGLESSGKHGDDYRVMTPTRGSLQGSGSVSPAVDRTPHVGCKQMILETPHSKSSSIDTSLENKGTVQSADEDSEVGVESRRMEESLLVESCRKDALPPKLTELDMQFPPERLICAVTDENNGLKHHDGALPLKEEDQVKNNADLLQSLLPPPLPNSPSESWLSRALPSVSAMNPLTQSFLGIQIHPKKQTINASSIDVKLIPSAKPPRRQRGPTRFADMLEKPQSPQSEI